MQKSLTVQKIELAIIIVMPELLPSAGGSCPMQISLAIELLCLVAPPQIVDPAYYIMVYMIGLLRIELCSSNIKATTKYIFQLHHNLLNCGSNYMYVVLENSLQLASSSKPVCASVTHTTH